MEERLPIVVDVDIKFNEYLKYGYTAFFKKTAWFVLLIFISVLSFYFINQGRTDLFQNLRLVSYSFLLFFLFVTVGLYLLIVKEWKNSPALFNQIRYSFSSTEINVKRGPLDTKISWDMIRKAEKIADFIVIYPNQIRTFLLPLGCFNNESEISELKELLREKLGDKAKLKQ